MLIATIIAGAVSLMMTCSFSEMVSVAPFSGGCYGYVRCSLGPVAGYIAGAMETSKYLLYTSIMFCLAGNCIAAACDLRDRWVPLISLALLIASTSLQICSTRAIWWAWGLVALLAVSCQLMFILSSAQAGKVANLLPDVNRFSEMLVAEFQGTMHYSEYNWPSLFERFMRALPFANFLFSGVVAVRICGNDLLAKTKATVPGVMVFVHCWTFIMVLVIIVATRANVVYPYQLVMLPTFARRSGVKMPIFSLSQRLMCLLFLPGALSAALGFHYASGRQIWSMTRSGFLPAFLGTSPVDAATEAPKPVVATIFSALLSFAITCVVYIDGVDNFIVVVARMAELQSCIVALGIASAFTVFATRFGAMKRGYESPFGKSGAFIVRCYYLLTFITMLLYDCKDRLVQCLVLVGYFVFCMTSFELVANKPRLFSKEEQEQEEFMKACILHGVHHAPYHQASKRRRRAHGRLKLSMKVKSLVVKAIANIAISTSPENSANAPADLMVAEAAGYDDSTLLDVPVLNNRVGLRIRPQR